jgi:hypothetical protein
MPKLREKIRWHIQCYWGNFVHIYNQSLGLTFIFAYSMFSSIRVYCQRTNTSMTKMHSQFASNSLSAGTTAACEEMLDASTIEGTTSFNDVAPRSLMFISNSA